MTAVKTVHSNWILTHLQSSEEQRVVISEGQPEANNASQWAILFVLFAAQCHSKIA